MPASRSSTSPGTDAPGTSAAIAQFVPGRLGFLDGLRGLAALGVLLNHLFVFCHLPAWEAALNWGGFRIGILFALSGFSLYLPGAARDEIELGFGFWELLRRRVRRLLPPWYGSLGVAGGVGALLAGLGQPTTYHFLPQDWGDLLSHLTLTHSLVKYAGSMNPPGYTLGFEWQLSLLMLPCIALVRRFGWAAALVPLMLLGVALEFPRVAHGPVGWVARLAPPSYSVPFVVGMLAARIARRPDKWKTPARGNRFWSLLLLTALVWHGLVLHLSSQASYGTAALFTLASVNLMARNPHGLLTRLFSLRPLQWAGSFCYSLYLIHFPLLALAAGLSGYLHLTPPARIGFICASVPLVLLAAWGFHFVFEVPFRRATPRASSAPATVPALGDNGTVFAVSAVQ